MRNPISVLLRDTALSFLPEGMRAIHRPDSTVTLIRATTITGILQFLLFTTLTVMRYRAFALLRGRQWSPVIGGASDAVHVTAMLILTLEFLIQPISLILIYFSIEGMARFVSGLVLEQPLASLPAVVVLKIQVWRREKRATDQARQQPPDVVEIISDGENVRIASCLPKLTWTPTITIGFHGHWYLVEREEKGVDPHIYIYVLKRAPTGRVLRAYEEYPPVEPASPASASR